MFIFLKKKNKEEAKISLINITSLLVHAARIDENYTEKERNIIRKTIIELSSKNEMIEDILEKAEKIEGNSNHILNFTKEIKNLDENSKIKIIETLWKIIYSDNIPDMYESSLMRKLTGLLYLDNKIVGDLKEKVKNNLKK